VRVNGRVPAAIVVPEVPGYPGDQTEIIAAVSLRSTLSLADGEQVRVVVRRPLRVAAAIFDVDGTLVDSLAAFRVVAERAAAPYNLAISDAMVREALNTSQSFWQLALPPDCADRQEKVAELTREAGRLWPDVLREHGRVHHGIEPALRTLRQAGLELGIVTGSRRGSIDPLRSAGLLDLFDAVVTGEHVERRKPDPQGLLRCAEALHIAPRDAVYIGDTPLDVQAARAAGMSAVGVLTGACDSAGLTLAGADHLVSTLDRLHDVLILSDAGR
jgi:HAD superfamily hydrolase (TIGR01509 family)